MVTCANLQRVCVHACCRFSYTMLPDKSMFSWESLEVLDAL